MDTVASERVSNSAGAPASPPLSHSRHPPSHPSRGPQVTTVEYATRSAPTSLEAAKAAMSTSSLREYVEATGAAVEPNASGAPYLFSSDGALARELGAEMRRLGCVTSRGDS